jgi:hypothetical protein
MYFSCHILSQRVFEKPSGQYLDFICDESLTRRGLNSNLGYFHGSAILPLFVWRIIFTYHVVCR